jgi:hypothetical protein
MGRSNDGIEAATRLFDVRKLPAVLVEAGSIVNRQEELERKRARRNACRQNAYRSLLHGTFPT